MSISTVIALVAAAAAVGALAWCWVLGRKLAAALERNTELQRLAEDGDIVGVAQRVEQRLDSLEAADECRRADDAALADRLERAVRHVGLVRYDAFPNAAGEQSFSLALMDDLGDGLVVTSIYGRGEYRMYAKALRQGGSSHSLTDEEREAIDRAREHSGIGVGR